MTTMTTMTTLFSHRLLLACGLLAATAGIAAAEPAGAVAEPAAQPAAEPATQPAAQPIAEEASPGQADLDAAVDAKLSAQSIDDFANVLDLCKRAIKKGLAEDQQRFAEDLYTDTLMYRAGRIVQAIYDAETPDPQWPRLRSFAMRDLNEVVGRDPTIGDAQLMVAQLESLPGGNRERARTAATKAIELLPDDKLQTAQAHVVLGNTADEDDREERASHYDKAVELAPRDKEIRRTRGLFHLLTDEFAKARTDLEAAIEADPEDASMQEALGLSLMMDDKLEDAEAAFDRAIKLDPDSSNALLQRARVRAMRGDRPEAIADLDKAVRIAPDEAIPLVLRARIHQQAGDTARASADIEQVLGKHPDHPAALELRGLIAAENNDYAAAIGDFRRLVAKKPDDAVLIGQLGMLYLGAKQPRQAIKRFSRSIEIDAKNFASWRGRSDAEISIGDHKAALADLEQALELEPADSGVLNNLAWLLATSPDDSIRDGKRAIELARKACEETTWKQPHIVSTLAAGYAESGDFDEARKYSKQAVDSDASSPEVKKQLEGELASYMAGKPWREKQEQEEQPLAAQRDGDLADPKQADPKQVELEKPAEKAVAEPKPPAKPRTRRRPFD
jgi:tetratricopeptide (TPR) repeat protein